ncbi:MAG: hypothetical protein AAF998_06750 [Bacteroidota bacterium]
MRISAAMKSLLLIGGLFIAIYGQGQTTLAPYKVTVFRDAAQVGWKGIVRFNNRFAEVPLPVAIDARGLDLIPGTEDVRVASYRLRQDTVLEKGLVRNWEDILKANISKPVSILYVLGAEYDEVSGTVRLVNAEDKLLLLHGDDDLEYFIPLGQIKQVIVETISDYRIDRKVVQDVLAIEINQDLAFVPLEMFTVRQGLSWSPQCRIRILGSDKARLQLMAIIRNEAGDLIDVETDLSPSSLLGEGQIEAELLSVGKMSLKQGDQIVLNVREAELQYTGLHRCAIPWDVRQTDGEPHSFSVDNTIKFKPPNPDNFPCQEYAVIDENNRSIANLGRTVTSADGTVSINLGTEKPMRVTLVETVTKRGKKTETIDGTEYRRISVEGKVACYNVGQKFIRLDLDRAIFGEVTDAPRAKTRRLGDSAYAQQLRWKLSLDKGQKKEFTYQYDALIPNPEP